MYILKGYLNTIFWDKTRISKKFPLDKINGKKYPLFFFCDFQFVTVLHLICDSYMSWSVRFVSLRVNFHFQISQLKKIARNFFARKNFTHIFPLFPYLLSHKKMTVLNKRRVLLLILLFRKKKVKKRRFWDQKIFTERK